ncbi:MAG: DUF3343 domain-containing protein [Oscillospiraceae bacterium]
MNKSLISMTSITYAIKAKSLLNSKKIFCEITNTPKNLGSGCGYSILVKENPEYITNLLNINNIPYKESMEIL